MGNWNVEKTDIWSAGRSYFADSSKRINIDFYFLVEDAWKNPVVDGHGGLVRMRTFSVAQPGDM